ncbi:4'-phosphopantetheinyl transferase, partial [Enterococcus faecium]
MLETAIEVLEKRAQLVTIPEEWGYESVTMEKEEIEMGMLPKDVHLPRLVMTHLYIYCAPEDGK